MTESLFDYDSNNLPLGSPDLFSKKSIDNFMNRDDFQFGNYIQDTNQFLFSQDGENLEFPNEPRNFDTLSNYSTNSTNYSSKQSPEYQYNQERVDDRGNDRRIPPIQKKNIRKYYEPIVDNNVVYRYEDNPTEYKKARKRIQNRESASRVRNRKKNYHEEMEQELQRVKKENEDLKVKNASLTAENNLLKQQIQFLERMVMKTGGVHDQTPTNTQANQPYLLPVSRDQDNIEEEKPKKDSHVELDFGYIRPAAPHTFKKHITLLSVFTIMVCLSYGMMAATKLDTSLEANLYPAGLGDFQRTVSFALQSVDDAALPRNREALQTMLKSLVDDHENYSLIKKGAWITFLVGNILYGLFVIFSIGNWAYLKNKKTKKQ